MQSPFNPKAGNNSVVDALIGNAYEVVKYVAYYVKEIRYVAFNMEHVYRVSQNMYSNVLKTLDITAKTTYTIDLPEGVTAPMIIGTSVHILTADGEIYGASEQNFSWVITGGQLSVTIPGTAPDALVGGQLSWLINWQSPVVVTE